MKKLTILIFIFLFFFSKNIYCNNIAVIDIEEVINNNQSYIEILKKIEISQNKGSSFLKKDELQLEKLVKEIEDSKILLSNIEINSLISEYNDNFNELTKKVELYNDHFQNQIIQIRNLILHEIIVLSETYAKKNNIDLVIDSTSYLIASHEINITNIIIEELNKNNLNLGFKNFEKN